MRLRARAFVPAASARNALVAALSIGVILTLVGCATTTTTAGSGPSSTTSSAYGQPSSAATTTPSPQEEVFAQVGSLPAGDLFGTGRDLFISNHRYDQRRIMAFTPTGNQLAELPYPSLPIEPYCTVFPIAGNAGHVNIAILSTSSLPAQGLKPPVTQYFMTGYDGHDFHQLWKTQLRAIDNGNPRLDCTSGNDMSVTYSGTLILFSYAESTTVVDAETGSIRTTLPGESAAVGNYFVNRKIGVDGVAVLDPKDFSTLYTDASNSGGSLNSILSSAIGHGSNPSFDGERIVDSSTSNLRILNIRTGKFTTTSVAGSFDSEHTLTSPDHHTLYVAVGQGIAAFDTDTLQVKWAVRTQGASICGANANQVAITANGQLVLLDAQDGSQQQYTTRVPCGIVAGNYLYARSIGDSDAPWAIYRLFN